MDELLQHCLKELAFEGDLGCSASRLREFIEDFYTSRISVQHSIDDSYIAFVWTVIVQQPSIEVGLLPGGQVSSGVYFPPQPRAGKKVQNAKDEQSDAFTTVKLDLITHAKDLQELVEKHGENLRIAVNPETCFVAITGSHARPSKLTPMVYASLQLIARSREKGISVLDIGRTTGYDQKTCFYIVKQLVDLDLIVKLRQGGNSQNFCIHKYFYDHSPTWKRVREEETRARDEAGANGADEPIEAADDVAPAVGTAFDHIDNRHLTSLDIIRQRLVKLLKCSPYQRQPYHNIAVRIGFRPQSRTDRRFFLSRLKELIIEGTIEKVYMPNKTIDSVSARTLCLRLVSAERIGDDGAIVAAQDDDEKEEQLLAIDDMVDESTRVKMTVTLHKQIIDCIEKAGIVGTILSELCDKLGAFDKRTVELLITRMERQPPPPHLADLSVVQVMETHGRERRYRFFTLSAYATLMEREGFEEPPGQHSIRCLADSKGFIETRESDFYTVRDDLLSFLSRFEGVISNKPKGRPRKTGKEGMQTSKPKEKVKKAKVFKNPILPDGTRKKGRPIKDPVIAEKRRQQRSRKAAAEKEREVDAGETKSSTLGGEQKGERGRIKRKRSEIDESESELEGEENEEFTIDDSRDTPASQPLPELRPSLSKRKRGRPPKETRVGKSRSGPASSNSLAEPPKHKGGRPRKTPRLGGVDNVSLTAASASINANAPNVDGADLSAVDNMTTENAEDRSQGLPPHKKKELSGVRASESSHVRPEGDVGIQGRHLEAQTLAYALPPLESTISNSTVEDEPIDIQSAVRLSDTDEQIKPRGSKRRKVARVSLSPKRKISNAHSNDNRTIDQGLESSLSKLDNNLGNDALLLPSEGSTFEEIEGRNETATLDTQGSLDSFHTLHQIAPSTPSTSGVATTRTPLSRLQGRRNLSHLRRENELVQLIEKSGGIVNSSLDRFNRMFTDFIEALAKTGETTSAPIGAQIDKRTLHATFDSLASSGRIKILTTTAWGVSGGSRIARIAYLPTVSDERLHEYLSSLGALALPDPTNNVRPQISVPKDTESPNTSRALANKWLFEEASTENHNERWPRNETRAQALFSNHEDVVREALLLEKQTLSQAYGFLMGKLMRARNFHLHAIEVFEAKNTTSYIVSREDRIIDRSYFETDIPLSVYCASISSPVYLPDIKNALATDEGKLMPMKDIPFEWRAALQVGRARSRERILDLLGILASLEVVTPLRTTDSATPLIQHHSHVEYPKGFEPMPPNWLSAVPIINPQYWRFNSTAPVYLLSLQQKDPLFYKTMSIIDLESAIAFWDELKRSGTDSVHAEIIRNHNCAAVSKPCNYVHRVTMAIKKAASWKADYTLSWYQTQYLKKFIDISNGNTPLQDEDFGATRLARISQITSAPINVVADFYASSRAIYLEELERARQYAQKMEAKRQKAEMKALLAQKGVEALQQRERMWDFMVEKAHPGELQEITAIRLKRLRQSFVQGRVVQDNLHWEQQIVETIQAVAKTREAGRLFSKLKRPVRQPRASGNVFSSRFIMVDNERPPDPLHPTELYQAKGITDTDKIPSLWKQSRKGKKKGKADDQDAEAALRSGDQMRHRRPRYHWTDETDELVRDASVIIRARCRSFHRLDWGALEQLFPKVTRNTVRQHIVHLREQAGVEAYLERLEARWYDVWVEHRGSPALPDHDIHSPTNFDLKAHIDFLRKHVDKNAIRIGLLDDNDDAQITLPADPNNFLSTLQGTKRAIRPEPDFLFNIAFGEEAREKLFLREAFVMEDDHDDEEVPVSDAIAFAEAVLKMVIGTPSDVYDPDSASTLLHSIGEADVTTAMTNLLSRNVLAKTVKDTARLAPGRSLKISEMNQNALGGPIPKDLFQDASQLEESYAPEQGVWREWPLLSTDGDTAALLQLLSDHRVDVKFDTSHARVSRVALDWNSKKADDDDFEVAIHIRVNTLQIPPSHKVTSPINIMERMDIVSSPGHGKTCTGVPAGCKLNSDGVVDCLGCIEESQRQLLIWSESERNVAQFMLRLIEGRGPEGMGVAELKENSRNTHTIEQCNIILQRLCKLPVPLTHPLGYSTSVVVEAKHASPWTATLPGFDQRTTKVFPRRWLGIGGERIAEVWDAGLRAVMGVLHQRPGITQVELLRRLRPVYDRQEMIELLNHLSSIGAAKFLTSPTLDGQTILEAITTLEDSAIHWFAERKRHWYQIS